MKKEEYYAELIKNLINSNDDQYNSEAAGAISVLLRRSKKLDSLLHRLTGTVLAYNFASMVAPPSKDSAEIMKSITSTVEEYLKAE